MNTKMFDHSERLIRKIQRVETLEAIERTWEATPSPDHEYLTKLRQRIRKTQNELRNMNGEDVACGGSNGKAADVNTETEDR